MSDNFVRRNLKRRFKGVKFTNQQLRANKRRRAIAAEETYIMPIASAKEDPDYEHLVDDIDGDYEEEDDNIQNSIGHSGKNSSKTEKASIPVTIDVEDPLQKTVDWLSTHPSSQTTSTCMATPILNSLLSKETSQNQLLRGLHILGTSNKKKSITLQDALYDTRLLTPALIQFVQQHAPLCPKHQQITIIRTVRKTGSKHRNRRFFACPHQDSHADGSMERCNFFCWVEDHPPLLQLLRAEKTNNNVNNNLCNNNNNNNRNDAVPKWLEYTLSQYRQKLIRLEKEELLQEVRGFNRRRQAILEYDGEEGICFEDIVISKLREKPAVKLSGHSNHDLVHVLLQECLFWLQLRLKTKLFNIKQFDNNISTKSSNKVNNKSNNNDNNASEHETLIELSESEDDTDIAPKIIKEKKEEMMIALSDSDESYSINDINTISRTCRNNSTTTDIRGKKEDSSLISLSESDSEQQSTQISLSDSGNDSNDDNDENNIDDIGSGSDNEIDLYDANNNDMCLDTDATLIKWYETHRGIVEDITVVRHTLMRLRATARWYFGVRRLRVAQCLALLQSLLLPSYSNNNYNTINKNINSTATNTTNKILNGGVCLMPTGHGKSLLFQLPALLCLDDCISRHIVHGESSSSFSTCVLVVSPLIALLTDQIAKLPPELYAHTISLSSNSNTNSAAQSANNSVMQLAGVSERLLEHRVHLVFVSPERLLSLSCRRLFGTYSGKVSLVCLDEAHCLSHWGLFFRPAFLQLTHIMKRVLCPERVLAVTATAGASVRHELQSIVSHLVSSHRSLSQRVSQSVPLLVCGDIRVTTQLGTQTAAVWQEEVRHLRHNLCLSALNVDTIKMKTNNNINNINNSDDSCVSVVMPKEEIVLQILKRLMCPPRDTSHGTLSSSSSSLSETLVNDYVKYDATQGVYIVYVSRRHEAEALATFLQSTLFNNNTNNSSYNNSNINSNNGEASSLQVAVYHGGMDSAQRAAVQRRFMKHPSSTSSFNIISKDTISKNTTSKGSKSNVLRVMVATAAFGLGIDHAGVSAVIHLSLPRSLETYLQEIGRAARGGATMEKKHNLSTGIGNSEAQCVLLFCAEECRSFSAMVHCDTLTELQILGFCASLRHHFLSQQTSLGIGYDTTSHHCFVRYSALRHALMTDNDTVLHSLLALLSSPSLYTTTNTTSIPEPHQDDTCLVIGETHRDTLLVTLRYSVAHLRVLLTQQTVSETHGDTRDTTAVTQQKLIKRLQQDTLCRMGLWYIVNCICDAHDTLTHTSLPHNTTSVEDEENNDTTVSFYSESELLFHDTHSATQKKKKHSYEDKIGLTTTLSVTDILRHLSNNCHNNNNNANNIHNTITVAQVFAIFNTLQHQLHLLSYTYTTSTSTSTLKTKGVGNEEGKQDTETTDNGLTISLTLYTRHAGTHHCDTTRLPALHLSHLLSSDITATLHFATALHRHLQNLSRHSATRIHTMYRCATAIAASVTHHCDTAELSSSERNEAVQYFLRWHVERDTGCNTPSSTDNENNNDDDVIMSQSEYDTLSVSQQQLVTELQQLFLATQLPFLSLIHRDTPETHHLESKRVTRVADIRRATQLIARDKILATQVSLLARYTLETLFKTTPALSQDTKHMRVAITRHIATLNRQCLAMCVAKVLQASFPLYNNNSTNSNNNSYNSFNNKNTYDHYHNRYSLLGITSYWTDGMKHDKNSSTNNSNNYIRDTVGTQSVYSDVCGAFRDIEFDELLSEIIKTLSSP